MQRTLIALFLLVFSAFAQPAPDPQKAGLDPARVEMIRARMKEFAQQGAVSGVVTLLERNGTLALFDAAGFQDATKGSPMQRDSIFQIMSMTKPVTGVGIMILAEQGRLRLNDPVEKHLPEFRNQMIAIRNAASVELKKPDRPITIRDLMTHTSGMIANPTAPIEKLLISMDVPLAEAVATYARQPLEFEPGSKWMYSNPGIATLGRIIEVCSGMSYEQFMEKRIFLPLGMTDSHFSLPDSKRARLAMVFTQKDGRLEYAPPTILAGDPMKFRPNQRYSGPEYGLYSTAWDLARLYRMMANGGVYNGTRILSPWSVREMSINHTGDIKAGWLPGSGFGLTWEVTRQTAGTLFGLPIGAYHHGGAFGTFGWIDPQTNMVGVFLVQHQESRSEVRDAFITMAASSVMP